MKKFKVTKESVALIFITILSAVFNFGNLSIEGTANSYYAAAAKSMTMSLKNFFFVSFDPAGFVSIDKPPLGFWFQAISAKLFGFSGWSILLPQALSGVISVVLLYFIVSRAFGKKAGLLSALCLAVTPVFVAASRNNTIDNVLVLFLLLACRALSIAAEKGKFKYLLLSMVFVGLGFNVKMLQAYMIIPAIYITYLFATAVSLKKRIIHLAAGTLVLVAVSLSWALIVDSVPADSRPYIDSSSNNSVMELIFGHNGAERLSLSSKGHGGPGGSGQDIPQQGRNTGSNSASSSQKVYGQQAQAEASSVNNGQKPDEKVQRNSEETAQEGGMPPEEPGSGMQGGPGPGGMSGGPGGGHSGSQGLSSDQSESGITRLFTKNVLSDQIVWFLIIAVFGFIAASIKEKLSFKLNDKRKQSLALWFMWFLPVFVFFSYNTGTFHPYYLTMLAPPAAALTGIGIVSMWELYIEGGWKSWFLPAALIANGAIQLLMQTYFLDTSYIVKILMILLLVLCFGASIMLSILNLLKKKDDSSQKNTLYLKKVLLSMAITGLLITPFIGSGAVIFTGVGSSFPQAGLELLADNQGQNGMGKSMPGDSNSGLTDYLIKNKTSSQKYLLVVSSSNSGADIIIKTGEPVMAIGGFGGRDNSITLEKFKELAKKGEVRYVMTSGNMMGGNRGPGNSGNGSESKNAVTEIMNWVKENGKAVSASEYSNADAPGGNMDAGESSDASKSDADKTDDSNPNGKNNGFGGEGRSQELYDLKSYTDSAASK